MLVRSILIGLFLTRLALTQENDFLKEALEPTPQAKTEKNDSGVRINYTMKDSEVLLELFNPGRTRTVYYKITFLGPDGKEVSSSTINITVPGGGTTQREITLPAGAVGFSMSEVETKGRNVKSEESGSESKVPQVNGSSYENQTLEPNYGEGMNLDEGSNADQ